MAETEQKSYKRVMLKISGEALMGDTAYGLHPPTVQRIAREVKIVHDMGVEICMVIGGGNIFRGLIGDGAPQENFPLREKFLLDQRSDRRGILSTIRRFIILVIVCARVVVLESRLEVGK